MNLFEQQILETIDKYEMIKEGQMVIAAVSGGYDSLCMLNVLCALKRLRKFEVCAVHINHKFRDEADADEKFVKNEAKRLGIECHSKAFDVLGYAEKNKISFETAGRQIRYGYFTEIASLYNDSVIATAHNANDSAESMLMHLMRGCGLTGLTGIRAVNGNIIRPLIEADRGSIEKYCDEKGLVPRHDVTNDTDDYRRNDIRHNVLSPILERCSLSSLVNTMDILSEDDDFLEEYAKEVALEVIKNTDNGIKIGVKEFNRLHPSMKRRVLKIALGEADADQQICLVHIDEIIKMAQKNYGGKFTKLPGGRIVKIENGEVVL